MGPTAVIVDANGTEPFKGASLPPVQALLTPPQCGEPLPHHSSPCSDSISSPVDDRHSWAQSPLPSPSAAAGRTSQQAASAAPLPLAPQATAASTRPTPSDDSDVLKWFAEFAGHVDAAEAFAVFKTVVKRAGLELPFSEAHVSDPGARFEMRQLDKDGESFKRNRLYPKDHPTVLNFYEQLRCAHWHARAPRGFAALGRAPELQQLIARTCGHLLERIAVGAHGLGGDGKAAVADRGTCKLRHRLCEPPLLMLLLNPQLQLALCAEVAVGMLCSTQPLPPDTAQHCAALHTFICVGAQMAIEECCGRMAHRLHNTDHRAAHLVGYVHRHQWPQPGLACHGLQKAFAEAAVRATRILDMQPLDAQGQKQPIPAVVLASGLAQPLAEATLAGGPECEASRGAWEVLCKVWGGVQGLPDAVAALQKAGPAPETAQELAQRLLQLCAKMHQWQEQQQQQQQQQQQDEAKQGSNQQQASPASPQVVWVHREDVTAQERAATGNSATSSANNGAACSPSTGTSSSSGNADGCQCHICMPIACKVLAVQLESLGLALLHRFAVECQEIGGAVWQRCPEQLAQLCMAHKAALGAARLDALLEPPRPRAVSTGDSQQQASAEPVTQPLPSLQQQQQQQQQQQPNGPSLPALQQQEPPPPQQQQQAVGMRRRWRQRRNQHRSVLPVTNSKALAVKVLSFLALLRRFEAQNHAEYYASGSAGMPMASGQHVDGQEEEEEQGSMSQEWQQPWWHSRLGRLQEQRRQRLKQHDQAQQEQQELGQLERSASATACSSSTCDHGSHCGSRAQASAAASHSSHAPHRNHTSRSSTDNGSFSSSTTSSNKLDFRLRMALANCLSFARRSKEKVAQLRAKEAPFTPAWALEALVLGTGPKPTGGSFGDMSGVNEVPMSHAAISRANAAMQNHANSYSFGLGVMRARATGGPCSLCLQEAADSKHKHGSSHCSNSSSSDSIGADADGCIELPPTSPYHWRSLLWRLLWRLKPSSARFWQQRGACHHVDDAGLWVRIHLSLRETLMPLDDVAEWRLANAGQPCARLAEERLARQRARALNQACDNCAEYAMISALFSAQVLSVFDPFEEALVPNMSLIEWFPSSFRQLLGRFLREEQLRTSAGMQHSIGCNFSKWPLLWHLQMQRQHGGDYSSYDARYAALRAAAAQLRSEEAAVLLPERQPPLRNVWEDPYLWNQGAGLLRTGICDRAGCGRHLYLPPLLPFLGKTAKPAAATAGLHGGAPLVLAPGVVPYQCMSCAVGTYCCRSCMELDTPAHAAVCRQLRRIGGGALPPSSFWGTHFMNLKLGQAVVLMQGSVPMLAQLPDRFGKQRAEMAAALAQEQAALGQDTKGQEAEGKEGTRDGVGKGSQGPAGGAQSNRGGGRRGGPKRKKGKGSGAVVAAAGDADGAAADVADGACGADAGAAGAASAAADGAAVCSADTGSAATGAAALAAPSPAAAAAAAATAAAAAAAAAAVEASKGKAGCDAGVTDGTAAQSTTAQASVPGTSNAAAAGEGSANAAAGDKAATPNADAQAESQPEADAGVKGDAESAATSGAGAEAAGKAKPDAAANAAAAADAEADDAADAAADAEAEAAGKAKPDAEASPATAADAAADGDGGVDPVPLSRPAELWLDRTLEAVQYSADGAGSATFAVQEPLLLSSLYKLDEKTLQIEVSRGTLSGVLPSMQAEFRWLS